MFSVLQTPNYGIFQVVDGKLIDVTGVGLVTSPLGESSGGGFPNKNLKGERFINNLPSYI